MGLHVSSEVGSVSKLLATMSTPVWLLSGVRPHVTLQQPGTRKCFATHVTLVTQVMGEDVHL